jgi:superoxide oxidase
MQLRDNGLRFSPVTIVLHWIVAALVFAIVGIGIALWLAPDDAQSGALMRAQNLLGTVLFVISVYRLWARISSYHPLPLGSPNPVEVIISRSVAAGLALAMVLLPIAVWLARSAAGVAIALPGGLMIPALIAPDTQVARVVNMLFEIGATAFLSGLALHMFGAFKNHVVAGNDALKRMLGKHVEL